MPSDDMLSEKRLSHESLYEGRIIHLFLDEVQLPNGSTAKREIIAHPGAVAIVPIDDAGNVIMVRQYRHAVGRILLEIPAGTLKVGEDPDLCADRELQEETGYKPGKLQKIGGIFVAPGYSSEYIHLYIASGLIESRLNMDEDEFIEVERYSFDALLSRIATGEIADGKTISAVLLARSVLGR